jgi:hypothetical protein
MSSKKRGETAEQKRKKNASRLKAKELGNFPSIQKRSYAKPKLEILNPNQNKLL